MRFPIKIAIPATAVGAMVVGGWALIPAARSSAPVPTVATPIVAHLDPAQTPTPEPSSTASEPPEPASPEAPGDTYADPPGQDVNHECPPACGPGETP
jgi:hypothetical protein